LVDGARFVHPRLEEVFAEVAPDVIVEDNVVGFPAVLTAGMPWVRIASCNPLEMKDPDLPPTFSGYPTEDPDGWNPFRRRYQEVHEDLLEGFSDFCMNVGAPRLPESEFIWESPYLNLSLYPEEADYPRSRPLSPTFHRLDSSVRTTDAEFQLPADLEGEEGALIYLSLGSLGAGDVELMQRLIDLLGQTPHRVLVSTGPQHELLRLADNMAGAEFLPQVSVLPQMDLVITHAGNNTVTECIHFGRPMLALPIFWDQHDNATRVEEAGFGARLDTYHFEDSELGTAVDRLLAANGMRKHLDSVSSRLRSSSGAERAADLIEGLA
jgi:UDP:flavonoid glycosyltransferase YjiC (YdhE family)